MKKLSYLLITILIFNTQLFGQEIETSNIEEIVKTKVTNIPILENDTNNVIEFNSSFSKEIKENKPRSFWNLLKSE